MTIERIEPEQRVRVVDALANTVANLRRAAQIFGDLEQFAAMNWDRSCYACYDWVALSRRMFRRILAALDQLRRSQGRDFEHAAEFYKSAQCCYEHIASVMDRDWFLRCVGPYQITVTVQNVLSELEHNLDSLALFENREHQKSETKSIESSILVEYREAAAENSPTIDKVLSDSAASSWIKSALHSALQRDPVDAANDAAVLAKILNARCQEALKGTGSAAVTTKGRPVGSRTSGRMAGD